MLDKNRDLEDGTKESKSQENNQLPREVGIRPQNHTKRGFILVRLGVPFFWHD